MPTPRSLVQHPCTPVGAGKTNQSLAKGYLINLTCIGEYKEVIDGIDEYNKGIEDVE